MLKGVCSRAHKLTHSTDVSRNNTGVNTEHLKITVQAEEDGSPAPKEVIQLAYKAWTRSPVVAPLGALIAEWCPTFLPEDLSLKAHS